MDPEDFSGIVPQVTDMIAYKGDPIGGIKVNSEDGSGSIWNR